MTRIDFYRCTEDKLRVACRLAAKAHAQSTRLVVYAPQREVLTEFDRSLWAYQATGFVPHCFVEAPVADETPVILATSGEALPHHDVLLNLADEWPPFFASFERVLELIGAGEADKERARERWSFYKKRGYDLKLHDIEG